MSDVGASDQMSISQTLSSPTVPFIQLVFVSWCMWSSHRSSL